MGIIEQTCANCACHYDGAACCGKCPRCGSTAQIDAPALPVRHGESKVASRLRFFNDRQSGR